MSEKNSIGFIYIIRAVDTHHYKVGFTTRDPLTRLSELQTGSPIPLELVYKWEGTMREEKSLHKILKTFITDSEREWFELRIGTLLEAISQTSQNLIFNNKRDKEAPLDAGEYGVVAIIEGAYEGLEGFFNEDLEKSMEDFPENYYKFLKEEDKVPDTESVFYAARVYVEAIGELILPYAVLRPL